MLGLRILEERQSPINGKIQVVADILGRVSIRAGGLTQSGGIAEKALGHTFRRLKNLNHKANNCLILGLGGGSAAKLINKLWPEAKIIGVDIDPIMIELGERYMDLNRIPNLQVVIQDATKFVKNPKLRNSFDVILVDVYQQNQVPEEAETEEFIKDVKILLGKGGVAIFNRFFYYKKQESAFTFREKLASIFSSIISITPEVNILFICFK